MLIEEIKNFDIFKDLEEIEVKKFLQFAQVKQFAQEEIIFMQGDPGNGLFLILKGVIEIFIEPGGKKISLAKLKAGEFMGEMSLFGEAQKRTASALAFERVTAVWISALDFRRLQTSGPKILSKLMLRMVLALAQRHRKIKQDIRQAQVKIEELKGSHAD